MERIDRREKEKEEALMRAEGKRGGRKLEREGVEEERKRGEIAFSLRVESEKKRIRKEEGRRTRETERGREVKREMEGARKKGTGEKEAG